MSHWRQLSEVRKMERVLVDQIFSQYNPSGGATCTITQGETGTINGGDIGDITITCS
jgi:hypothetical protein